MKAKYGTDPLINIYNCLNEELKCYLDFVHNPKYGLKYKIIDDVIKLILQNNDCKFSSYVLAKEVTISDDYYLYLVSGAKGNDTLEFYDYIELYGSKYLVVFLDYFKDMKPKPKYDNMESIESIAGSLMGNYNYTEAIKKIVEVYIETSECCSSIAASSASYRYYTAPIYLSAKVIDNLVGLQESDIGNTLLNFDSIVNTLSNNSIEAVLLGLCK